MQDREIVQNQLLEYDRMIGECAQAGDEHFRKLYVYAKSLCEKALRAAPVAEKAPPVAIQARVEAFQKSEPSLSRILEKMLSDGVARGVDGLIVAAGKPAHEVLVELLKLEIGGKIKKLAGGRFQRK